MILVYYLIWELLFIHYYQDKFSKLLKWSKVEKYFMQFSEHTFVFSEMYQQLEGFCQIISYLKSLVAADCEEDLEVYHPAAQNLLLIFWECDLFNYQWCVSFFLESVKRLSQHYLEVYEKFMAGDFLVQKNPVISNAAFLDIVLLKSIQKSQKSAGNIKEQAIRQLSNVTVLQVNCTREFCFK